MNYKSIFHYIILFLPLCILSYVLFVFIQSVYLVRQVSYDEIYNDIAYFYKHRQVKPFLLPNNLKEIDQQDNSIFIFGASSTVISNDKVFSHYLEKNLSQFSGKPVKVVNLGISGIESTLVKRRVFRALKHTPHKPILVLIYFGHNDYNVTYTSVVNRKFMDFFKFFISIEYFFGNKNFVFLDQKFVFGRDNFNNSMYWYKVFNFGKYLRLIQKMGLYSIPQKKIDRINDLILSNFKSNVYEIISYCKNEGIPLAFVTPIGNLKAPGYGNSKLIDENHEIARNEQDYEKSIKHFTKAKDYEIFTGDIRAKTPLLEFLRTVKNDQDVFVFDLEKDFIEEKFNFDNKNFLDYFHFNDQTHRLVATYLAKEISNLSIGVTKSE